MPALYTLDSYEKCLQNSEGVYCLVDGFIDVNLQSDLVDLLRNYSSYKIRHFDRTQIHRGVCLTSTCKEYLNSELLDRQETLQACLNETLWNDHRLQINGVNVQYCETSRSGDQIDEADIILAAVYIIIIALNAAGTVYDVKRKNKNDGDQYLLSFSILQNWKRLTAPSGEGPDPRLNRLKCFNGLRTITMICVFFSHTVLIMAFSYVDNPIYIEKSYEDPLKQILFNGSLVTFTFFTMSSFLLAYNMEIHAETHNIGWIQLPRGILHRWLRLTPTYALVIGTIATWMRHLGDGPVWRAVVGTESEACRLYWWSHLLYINNYIYSDAYCFPQSWYLAADTQLFFVGLIICILARTTKSRKIVLGIMFLLSLIIPGMQTYLQDLDAVVLQTPETYRNLYKSDSTFRWMYVSGHANLATYTMGLTGGFLAYTWQKTELDVTQYKKLRYLFWAVFPAGIAIMLSGGFFYADGARAHILYRVLYATFYKPIFQFLVVVLILGVIFKIDNTYRAILEWRGWSCAGRVSFAGFLLHSLFQRGLVGSLREPTHLTDYYVLMILSGTIFLTFAAAALLFVLVEAPICRLVKIALNPQTPHKKVLLYSVEIKSLSSKL